jgi:hypothetical protein
MRQQADAHCSVLVLTLQKFDPIEFDQVNTAIFLGDAA